ncbi:hypothetical protein MC885_006106 [Smutsia gigantea]|nr:hypothetical protein MC885_006106 [Smutsia gigantea]
MTAMRPRPQGLCSTWLGSSSGNSHRSAARLSLTLIQLTAGQVRSVPELHLIKSPEDWCYPLLRSC